MNKEGQSCRADRRGYGQGMSGIVEIFFFFFFFILLVKMSCGFALCLSCSASMSAGQSASFSSFDINTQNVFYCKTHREILISLR